MISDTHEIFDWLTPAGKKQLEECIKIKAIRYEDGFFYFHSAVDVYGEHPKGTAEAIEFVLLCLFHSLKREQHHHG